MSAGDARTAVARVVATNWPALLVGAACVGIALSVWIRLPAAPLALAALLALAGALLARETARVALAAAALGCAGLW
jgi:hypothetical protein